MDDENYFGGQSAIPKDMSQDEQSEMSVSQGINLSEYLDKAYDKFDPNYKIRFEGDQENNEDDDN